jgi:hypothetical protein
MVRLTNHQTCIIVDEFMEFYQELSTASSPLVDQALDDLKEEFSSVSPDEAIAQLESEIREEIPDLLGVPDDQLERLIAGATGSAEERLSKLLQVAATFTVYVMLDEEVAR